MAHTLPDLPYAPSALAPVLSAESFEYHHGKHHRAYVDTLNDLVKGTPDARVSLEALIRSKQGKLFNQAAQHANHSLFWTSMTPGGRELPPGELRDRVVRDFGSFDGLVAEFKAAALGVFGSGWCWLVDRPDGGLAVMTTANADSPLRTGAVPLLVCDVWEHAYYVDYRNDRKAWIDGFLSVADWAGAAARLESRRTAQTV